MERMRVTYQIYNTLLEQHVMIVTYGFRLWHSDMNKGHYRIISPIILKNILHVVGESTSYW